MFALKPQQKLVFKRKPGPQKGIPPNESNAARRWQACPMNLWRLFPQCCLGICHDNGSERPSLEPLRRPQPSAVLGGERILEMLGKLQMPWIIGFGRIPAVLSRGNSRKSSDSVKRHLRGRHLSVLNLKFDFISDGGCTREEQIALSLKRHLFPHGGREPKAFWICFSRVHPPSEIKSNFKFKTLKRHLLKLHLTLSEKLWERFLGLSGKFFLEFLLESPSSTGGVAYF